MDVEPIALVRLIDRLEADTLLERRLDPRDRRVWRLYPTEKATPTLERIRHISAAVRGRALTNVAPQASAALLGVLQQLRANLSATATVPEPDASAGGNGSLAAQDAVS